MNKGSTWFLRGVIIIIGLIVLGICIFGIPRVIGTFEMGGYDPILLGLYVPALPFFFALYQALRLLGYIDHNTAFSHLSVQALKNIKYSALAISGLFAAGMPYIFYVADQDDAPGVVAIGLVIIGASFIIATFAAVLQKLFASALEIKAENDMTV